MECDTFRFNNGLHRHLRVIHFNQASCDQQENRCFNRYASKFSSFGRIDLKSRLHVKDKQTDRSRQTKTGKQTNKLVWDIEDNSIEIAWFYSQTRLCVCQYLGQQHGSTKWLSISNKMTYFVWRNRTLAGDGRQRPDSLRGQFRARLWGRGVRILEWEVRVLVAPKKKWCMDGRYDKEVYESFRNGMICLK